MTGKRNTLLLAAAAWTVLAWGNFTWIPGTVSCQASQTIVSGRTMGTYYQVKIISGGRVDAATMKKQIDALLEGINGRLSMFDPDSELSKFNQWPANRPFLASPGFLKLMSTAGRIYRLTDGAWDGTVKPLVDLWGFGTQDPLRTLPDKNEILLLLSRTGFDKIRIDPPQLQKTISGLTLDLSSIAKGYAVDQTAAFLEQKGFDNFLVDIGGEIAAAGTSEPGRKWKIGIDTPDPATPHQKVYLALALENQSIATSGDYRNFTVIDGRSYSHIIDPATGYPVKNRVASVSVIASNCAFADGLATAMMVMGADRAIALADRLEQVAAMIVLRIRDDEFENLYSSGFEAFIVP